MVKLTKFAQSTPSTAFFKDNFSLYKNMLLEGDLESLWRIAEKGDALAEFVLEQFYKEKVLPHAIKTYDLLEMQSVLDIISTYATKGHPFGVFLLESVKKSIYLANNKENVNSYNIRECNRIRDQLDEECASLCAEKGFEFVESKIIEKEDGLLLLKKAAEKYHPLAMAWYGSYLYEGLHRVRKNEDLGRFYIELAVYAGDNHALKLNEKYELGFEQYEEHLIPSKENFTFTGGRLQMKSFPRYLTEKYISRFMAESKDILFDKKGLSQTLQLINTKHSLAIHSDEIVFVAVSACFFGHFKTNMNGLAITSKGIHINGGNFCGGVGFIDWETLQDASIFIRDGLRIDNFSLICSSLEDLLKEILLDLREITRLVLLSEDIYEHQSIDDNVTIATEVSGAMDNDECCEVRKPQSSEEQVPVRVPIQTTESDDNTQASIQAKSESKVSLASDKTEITKKKEERKNNPKNLAIASLLLGIVSYLSILTIIIPIATSITGLIVGFKGFKSDLKNTAVMGIITNLSFLILFVAILIFA
jgi:hypothetical protein